MNKENLGGDLYVWLHGNSEIVGITYRDAFCPDYGYYTIGGDRPLLLPRALVEEWELSDATRPASTQERLGGCRFERVATADGDRWEVPSAPSDYDHRDVIIHYRGGSDSRSPSKYEPHIVFEEALDDVIGRATRGRE